MRLAQVFSSFYKGYVIPSYGQNVIWMSRIDQRMQSAGATPTPAWDVISGESDSFSDGTFGSAWSMGGRQGYLGPVIIPVAINDTARIQEITADGVIQMYEGPMIFWQDPYILKKDDLIAKTDGSGDRYRVGDMVRPYQVWGHGIVNLAKLVKPQTNDILYLVPLI